MDQKKHSVSYILLDIPVVLLIFLIFIPQFSLLSNYNYLVLTMQIFWFFLAFLYQPQFFLNKTEGIRTSFVLIGIILCIPLLFDNYLIFNRYVNLVSLVFFYWFFRFNIIYRGNRFNLRIVYVSIIPILYSSLSTVRVLRDNPYASRLITSSLEENKDLVALGVGGYSLIYSVVIILLTICPVFLILRKLNMSFFRKAVFIVVFCVLGLLVIYSNFFTALILTIIGLIFIYAFFKSIRYIGFFVFIGIVYFIFSNEINLLFIDILLNFLQEDGKSYQRLYEIKNSITFGSTTSSVDSRSEVLEITRNTFFDNPLFGYIINSNYSFDLKNIGQHSTLFDTLALYGVFFGAVYFIIIGRPILKIVNVANNLKVKSYAVIVSLVFIVLIGTNNVTISIAYAFYFLFPTILEFINIDNYEKGR
ncbi:hypothetical protein [Myroides marinus]|uniref:hypothetical protein n=1 Tax=Myroides marinus TaxID=703342 RepID=UPI0025786D5D|nr:hypothetical protein [Myroides marinus]MDM1376772.1 hypothetical protein [Myroides marinus]